MISGPPPLPPKKENKNDAGSNVSNQSICSPQVCFLFLFDPVHPSAFCSSRKYTFHIKNFSFSPPPFPFQSSRKFRNDIIDHHTLYHKKYDSESQYMPFERGGQQCIFIYSYNIFSSNIMLIPSFLSKKIGHFQLGALSC